MSGRNFNDDPKYITQLSGNENDPDDDSYAMPYSELQELLNKVCISLRHPATVLNLNYNIENGPFAPIRVDSTASYFSLSNPCRNLRNVAGEEICYKCDYYYAHMLKQLLKNNNTSIIPPSHLNSDTFVPPELHTCKSVSYIQYDCKMLGYCELCFAIKFHNNVLGVLFVGNTIIEDNNLKPKDVPFLRYSVINDCRFADYIKKYTEYKPEDIITYIEKSYEDEEQLLKHILPSITDDCNAIENYRRPLTKAGFDCFIEKCCQSVIEIQDEIERAWENKQRQYYRKNISIAKLQFDNEFNKLRGREDVTYDNMQDLYRSIWTFVIELKKDYNLSYCRLFDNLPFISGSYYAKTLYKERKNDIGECVYELVEPNDKSAGQSVTLDFTKIRKDFSKAKLNSFECKSSLCLDEKDEENPLSCFSVNGRVLSGENEVVLACSNLAVIFGVKVSAIGRKELIIFDEISIAFAKICSQLQELSSAFLKKKYSDTLSLYRHDCVHHALRIESRNVEYYDREKYEQLPQSIRENIFRDISSVAKSLRNVSKNLELVTQPYECNKRLVIDRLNLNDEINTWNAMYRLELKDQAKRIRKTTSYYDYYRTIATNKELFCNMLQNIVDNAIKYSAFGSIIDIMLQPHGNSYQLVITDIGAEIEDSRRPYDIYYRSQEQALKVIGDGIGLYSALKTCDILGLTISHSCEKISDYHFPLLRAARNRGMDIVEEFGEDVFRQAKTDEYKNHDFLVTDHDATLPKEKIKKLFQKPLYKVSFIIDGIKE